MKHCKRLLFLICIPALVLTAHPAWGYQVLLDIDTDGDPSTINEMTAETSALVKIVLRPTAPGETIGRIEFSIERTCFYCPWYDFTGEGTYGTSLDMFYDGWVTAPGFDSWAAYTVQLGCLNGMTSDMLLWFEPKGGTFTLNEPIFIGEFNAWVNTVSEDCLQPPSDLMTLYAYGVYWNRVLLNGGAYGTETGSWGRIKSIYR